MSSAVKFKSMSEKIEALESDVEDYKAIVSAQEKISNPLLARVYDEVSLRRRIRDLEDAQIEVAKNLEAALRENCNLRRRLRDAGA